MTRNMTQQINKPSNINDFTHIITGSIPVRVTTNESHNHVILLGYGICIFTIRQ